MTGTFAYTGFQNGFDKLLYTHVFIFIKTIANSYWALSLFQGLCFICIVTPDSHNSLIIQNYYSQFTDEKTEA